VEVVGELPGPRGRGQTVPELDRTSVRPMLTKSKPNIPEYVYAVSISQISSRLVKREMEQKREKSHFFCQIRALSGTFFVRG
jgi:hypothetical protein